MNCIVGLTFVFLFVVTMGKSKYKERSKLHSRSAFKTVNDLFSFRRRKRKLTPSEVGRLYRFLENDVDGTGCPLCTKQHCPPSKKANEKSFWNVINDCICFVFFSSFCQ